MPVMVPFNHCNSICGTEYCLFASGSSIVSVCLFLSSASLAPDLEATGFCKQSSPVDMFTASTPKTFFIVSALLLIIGPQVTMSDLKPAEVIHFLLIVREISVVVVIKWARKLVDWEC